MIPSQRDSFIGIPLSQLCNITHNDQKFTIIAVIVDLKVNLKIIHFLNFVVDNYKNLILYQIYSKFRNFLSILINKILKNYSLFCNSFKNTKLPLGEKATFGCSKIFKNDAFPLDESCSATNNAFIQGIIS